MCGVFRRLDRTGETIGHPTTTLEDLFLRIVAQSKAHPGRRYMPDEQPRTVPAATADELKTHVKR